MSSVSRNHWILLCLMLVLVVFASCVQQDDSSAADADADYEDGYSTEAVEAEPASADPQAANTLAPAKQAVTQPKAAPKAAAPKAAAPPAPRYVTVSVPAGTEIEVEMIEMVSSGTSQVGDPVYARLTRDLYAGDRLVAVAGSELNGTVAEVVPLKKIGGQAKLAVAFDALSVEGGERVAMNAWLVQEGKKQAGKDAAKIGGGAAAGAILGHQVDDKKGKVIGGIIGGAIGTAVAANTGKEVELTPGTMYVVTLEGDVQVRVQS